MTVPNVLSLIARRDIHRFFRWPEAHPRDCLRSTPDGYSLVVIGPGASMAPDIARAVMPAGATDIMRWRFRSGLATLLVLRAAGGEIAAYGWVQSWKPFRRRFRKVATSGVMLGFFWTAPEHRRKGLYDYLLKRSIAAAPRAEPIFIFTDPRNAASLRAIERVGFAFLLDLKVWRLFHVFSMSTILGRSDGA